jgi:hypothetical protein
MDRYWTEARECLNLSIRRAGNDEVATSSFHRAAPLAKKTRAPGGARRRLEPSLILSPRSFPPHEPGATCKQKDD